MRLIAVLASVAALGPGLLTPGSARAGVVIQAGVELQTGNRYTKNFMQGYDFFSTSDQYLTALGLWDEAADGLPGAYQVGVWDTAAQTLLASVVIDDADPIDPAVTVANGNWRYELLPAPLALVAGGTYTLAFQVGETDLSPADSLFINYPTLGVDPGVTAPNLMRFLSTGEFTFPTIALDANEFFRAMPNARLTTSVTTVPGPSALVLAAGGVGLLGCGRLRRKRAGADA